MSLRSYDDLLAELEPERAVLLAHPLYREVQSLAALRVFMSEHVFAVWDFMSLLKDLQRRLTTTTVPWTPPRSAVAAHLVNLIVLGEESDVVTLPGAQGPSTLSHFELYRLAMREIGASDGGIESLLEALRRGRGLTAALEAAPAHVRRFVGATFEAIASPHDEVPAAAFLVGREDLVPAMFERLLPATEGRAPALACYLTRHIELDGGEHGPLARRLLGEICGTDPVRWSRAAEAGRNAVLARTALWDGVVAGLSRRNVFGQA